MKSDEVAPDRGRILEKYLQAYWLRPENAMWMALRSEALHRVPLVGPAADFCCGDGLFSFLHHGGALVPSFDVFQGLTCPDQNPAVDMFDSISDSYDPIVLSKPNQIMDLGTDHKPNLLSKASMLGWYGRLTHHDHNHSLPLDESSLRWIYCNASYWLQEIDGFLRDCRRVLEPSGVLILHVKLACTSSWSLADNEAVLGSRFLRAIVGDRLSNWPTLASERDWVDRVRSAGLHVKDVSVVARELHARLWDVGLRPLAPAIIHLANTAPAHDRQRSKDLWIKTLYDLALPFCDPDFSWGGQRSQPVELQIVAAKR